MLYEEFIILKVISRIRQQFEVEMPIKALFEYPVLSELAEHIVTQQEKERERRNWKCHQIETKLVAVMCVSAFAQRRQLKPRNTYTWF